MPIRLFRVSVSTAILLVFFSSRVAISLTTINLYASTSSGSDVTGSGTSGQPYATIAKALARIPFLIDQPYQINLAAGTYSEPVSFVGYTGTFSNQVKIVGDIVTPANVVINGSTTCAVSDQFTGYTATVCNTSNAFLNLAGVTLTAASGVGRSIMTMDQGHTVITSVTLNCPTLADPNLSCVENALGSTLEIISPVTMNLTGATASGIGVEVNQGSEAYFYGDSGNGAFTIAGPNVNTDSLIGIQVHRRGLFDMHMIAANQTSTVAITGVSLGIRVVGGTFMQHNTGSANPQITISHSSGTSGTGVFVEAGYWLANVGGLQLTNLATGFQADSAGNIFQKNCSFTNVSTHSNIAAGSGFSCF